MKLVLRVGLLSVLTLGANSHALAQFYAGKTINMIINYGAGGTIDIEGRIIQRHLPKHIPGKPTIVVQNVPGAGGLTAINAMGKNVGSRPDGLSIGFFAFSPIAAVTKDPALQVDISDFAAIGGLGAWYVAYGRKDMIPGGKRPADMATAQNVFAAGYSRTSVHDVRMRLTLDLMGAKYKIIRGFQDVAAVNKAMLQDEVNFTVISLPGFENHTMPHLIQPGIAVPLWQYPLSGPNGTSIGKAQLLARGIPTFAEVYREAFGNMPSGPQFEAFMLLNDLSARLGRVMLLPPGAPAAAIADLRKAYAALANDEQFKTEYLNIVKVEADPAKPEDSVEVLEKLKTVDTTLTAAIKQAAGTE
jgi:hypothetical protein